jgi:hypothetical protein
MEWYNKIRNNCERATFLIDKKNLDGINPIQNIELRIHLPGCSICRLYDRQSQVINHLIRQFKQASLPSELRLDERFKKDMEEMVSQQLKNNLRFC